MTSSQEPVKSTSCILCKRSLKGTPQNCNFCSAPQDSNELIKRSFKECHKCCKNIFSESKLCIYQDCRALQKTPPSTPAHEEIGQSFPQNPPINTTNVTQLHDHSSHPLQLPQDSPDMSLQPTDKPDITKEQKLEKFKSPSISASPSPLTTEHDCSSTDHRQDSASTSLAKRVSGPQKRSSDDEDETNEAARVSGAVTSEKVENTYGIVGEANDNGSSSVPRKRKPSDHDHDSLETPSSKKPETLGSTEAHDEDWVMLYREEIQHDMESPRNEQGSKPEDRKKEKEIESQGNNKDITKGEVKPINNDTAVPKQPADGARENEESYIAEASDSKSEFSSSNISHGKSSSASSHSNSTPGTPALTRSSNDAAGNASLKNDAKPVDVHKPPIEESSSTYKPANADGEKNGMDGIFEESGKDLGEKHREGDGAKDEANGKGAAEDNGKGGASGQRCDGKDGGDGKADGGEGKTDGGDGKGGASGKATDRGKSGNAKNEAVSADDAVNSGTSGNVTGENVGTTGKSAGGDKGKDRPNVKGDDGGNVKSAAGGDGDGGGKSEAMEKESKGTSGNGDEEKSGKGGGKGKGKGKKDESNEKGSDQGGKDNGSGKSAENGKGETSFVGEENESQNEKKIRLIVPNL